VSLLHRLSELRGSGDRGVLFTVVEGEGIGGKELLLETGERLGGGVPEEATGQFDEIVRRGRNKLLSLDGDVKVFAEWYGPPPRVFIYGAVDTAEALCRAVKLIGWTAIVGDARAMFLTRERMPSADVLIQRWPEEAMAEIEPDHQTAVVVLTHDDKFDEPALKAALESEAFYIGALGSRRNQEKRRARLLEAGVPEEALARIAGPCGLDIGAESQEETALSILGEILAVRAGRSGGFLRDAKRRIHAQEDAPAPSPAA
jgi:xanthine dehydrogenase accessory factor